MDTIQDAIKYDSVQQFAKDFYYDKCHGYPEDIIKEIEKLLNDTVEATKAIEAERKILENIPF